MRRILVFLFSLLFLVSCKQEPLKENKVQDAINVKVIRPEYISFSSSVRASGILTTRTEMKLSFKTGGIIESIKVNEGQFVKEGELLASLDLSEINAHVQQAGIAYEKARRDYNRANNLYKDSVATLETVQNARSAVDLARAQKKIAEFNLQHSRIIAPSNGRIQKIIAEKNEMTAPGYPVILFASTENDWIVRVSLADKDIIKFKTGDSATVEMDPFPKRSFPAVISESGSFADPVTGTYEVELLLTEEDPDFRTGFIARTSLYPSDSVSGFWLPFEAVHDLDGRNGFVYLLDSLHVVKREVSTGEIINKGILIMKGLSIQDEVVTEGASYLKEGSLVNVLTPENYSR